MSVYTPQINEWWWIDAIQMGMPGFAKMGKLTGEQKYFDKMWQMYEYTRNQHGEHGMFNQKDGLWWRDQDFDPPYKEPNGEDCYWSRGNGWVGAAYFDTWQWFNLSKYLVEVEDIPILLRLNTAFDCPFIQHLHLMLMPVP